jgi:histidine triad (HIT) family protein
MADCVFCKIVAGDIPSRKVYEDDYVVAFHDINPVAPVHIQVIPKKHIASILEVTPEDTPVIGAIHQAVKTISREQGIADDGFRVVVNCGKNGLQTVYHLHYHLVGGRAMKWPPG